MDDQHKIYRTGLLALPRSFLLCCWVAALLLLGTGRGVVLHAQENGLDQSGQHEMPKIVFAVGEWAPLISENLPDYGKHSQRVKEIFQAMGYQVVFDFMPWKRVYEVTMEGKYVATFSWLKTKERSNLFYYPDYPIARANQVSFYKKDQFPKGLKIKEIEDVKKFGFIPVGVKSYWYEELFEKAGIKAEMVSNSDIAWRFLDAGRADIFFEEKNVGLNDMIHILGKGAIDRYAFGPVVKSDPMYILFSKKNPEGQKILNAYNRFMAGPEGQSMCEMWQLCPSENSQ